MVVESAVTWCFSRVLKNKCKEIKWFQEHLWWIVLKKYQEILPVHRKNQWFAYSPCLSFSPQTNFIMKYSDINNNRCRIEEFKNTINEIYTLFLLNMNVFKELLYSTAQSAPIVFTSLFNYLLLGSLAAYLILYLWDQAWMGAFITCL